MGKLERDSQNGTGRLEQLEPNCQDRAVRKGCQNWAARIRQQGQERKERTARKRQPEQDN
jgi:hypothetical protein